ncbi:hypothetical protein H920_18151 [Fukomys damarensis]|uniref:Uncharacterized protein n=1 Tax=Fukomys damarensis TaxID=885580 RepID=A0A091DCB8_FUKDA|nr:hypothetical protein H920_18151 [Fukomys damarensis]
MDVKLVSTKVYFCAGFGPCCGSALGAVPLRDVEKTVAETSCKYKIDEKCVLQHSLLSPGFESVQIRKDEVLGAAVGCEGTLGMVSFMRDQEQKEHHDRNLMEMSGQGAGISLGSTQSSVVRPRTPTIPCRLIVHHQWQGYPFAFPDQGLEESQLRKGGVLAEVIACEELLAQSLPSIHKLRQVFQCPAKKFNSGNKTIFVVDIQASTLVYVAMKKTFLVEVVDVQVCPIVDITCFLVLNFLSEVRKETLVNPVSPCFVTNCPLKDQASDQVWYKNTNVEGSMCLWIAFSMSSDTLMEQPSEKEEQESCQVTSWLPSREDRDAEKTMAGNSCNIRFPSREYQDDKKSIEWSFMQMNREGSRAHGEPREALPLKITWIQVGAGVILHQYRIGVLEESGGMLRMLCREALEVVRYVTAKAQQILPNHSGSACGTASTGEFSGVHWEMFVSEDGTVSLAIIPVRKEAMKKELRQCSNRETALFDAEHQVRDPEVTMSPVTLVIAFSMARFQALCFLCHTLEPGVQVREIEFRDRDSFPGNHPSIQGFQKRVVGCQECYVEKHLQLSGFKGFRRVQLMITTCELFVMSYSEGTFEEVPWSPISLLFDMVDNKGKTRDLPEWLMDIWYISYCSQYENDSGIFKGPCWRSSLERCAIFSYGRTTSLHMKIANVPLDTLVFSLLFDVCDSKGIMKNSSQYQPAPLKRDEGCQVGYGQNLLQMSGKYTSDGENFFFGGIENDQENPKVDIAWFYGPDIPRYVNRSLCLTWYCCGLCPGILQRAQLVIRFYEILPTFSCGTISSFHMNIAKGPLGTFGFSLLFDMCDNEASTDFLSKEEDFSYRDLSLENHTYQDREESELHKETVMSLVIT